MTRKDDRITNTSNIIVYGTELRELRSEDLERWKRRLSRDVEAQKFKEFSGISSERIYQEGANDAYDMVLKIIGAKWKNI